MIRAKAVKMTAIFENKNRLLNKKKITFIHRFRDRTKAWGEKRVGFQFTLESPHYHMLGKETFER